MIKKLQKCLIILLALGFFSADALLAQQEVMVRELHTYEDPLTSQADLPGHPLVGVEVTFDAVVIGYPRNSGLANLTEGIPNRIHVFVADVNAAEEGLDGNSIQIVVAGTQRATLETLLAGDVIRIVGELAFFNNVSQFDASDVTLLGSVFDPEYEDLQFVLEPTVITMDELNIPSPNSPGQYRWNAENYTKYINRYVKVEGVEIIDRIEAPVGRPWFITSSGNSILTSNDTSLRYRNDKTNYADGLNYNWRRLDDHLDGPFTPPPAGSVIDLSGFIVVNTFNPGPGFDESGAQSTLKIAPWDDGVLWTADGTNPDNRLTPPGYPNDLVVLGFAPQLDNFVVLPEGDISPDDNVSLSIDVLLPDESYTLESVVVDYEVIPAGEESGDTFSENMTADGNTYNFVFDTFDAFTTVNYTIVATASTPESVQTTARQSGSFVVVTDSQVAPVTFSPGSGTYTNAVQVTMATVTSGAQIFYTVNGDDPDDESTPYTSPVTFTQSVEVKAIAFADGMDPSIITSANYEVEVDAVEMPTVADLRVAAQDGTEYQYTGDGVITYTRGARNAKYFQDETGGMLIDDPGSGVIVSEYNMGDIITGVLGTLGTFNQLVQFVPSVDPGPSPGTADVVAVPTTLAELNALEHESRLVVIEDVTFLADGNFTAGTNFDITDPSLEPEEAVIFRTAFSESNYIGTAIPQEAVTLTALVGNFGGTLQLTARFDSDIVPSTSIPEDGRPVEFKLAQNYPNPFNPTTNISYSLANTADVSLVVYDILGRRVATLVNARQQMPGLYNVTFDATRLASGTYIYRLEAGDFVSTKKMLLVK
jgi:hypothetical protein